MDVRSVVVFVVFLSLAGLAMFYYVGLGYETSIETAETTTTTAAAASTTTTQPYTGSASIADMKASNASAENVLWLERRTFDLVNEERASHGLGALSWNEEVAEVARGHSEDMAVNGFFSHTGSDGSNTSARLRAGDVWYWNSSAENLFMSSGVSYYVTNVLGMVRKTEYSTFEQLAQNATQGWMNSTGHRENILNAGLDEAGMGVYVFNDSYYFTQDFITRVVCGYNGGSCCEEAGYYPWCYVPWKCEDGTCLPVA